MSKEGADNYLGAIRDSLQSPNMILDLRIPSLPSTRGVLDTAVAFRPGAHPRPDDAADRAGLGEDHRREEKRDKQKEAYASSLNIQR